MEQWKRNLIVCWFGVLVTSSGLSQLTPILPLYIEQLGIHDVHAMEQWAGFTYGVTFITMALVSPLWGKAADRYGRKPMLLRASMGMALVVTSMGFVTNVYQLAGLRLLQGTISGFYSASITLVATQTPREKSGWALGTLSTGALAGMLLGPLFGGYLAEFWGIRSVFYVIGGLLIIAFSASWLLVKEDFVPSAKQSQSFREIWGSLQDPGIIIAMFVTTMVLQMGLMSIQPIITVYIIQLAEKTSRVALMSGMVFSAAGLASIIAAPSLGKLSDRIGPHKIMLGALIAAGLFLIPQAFVSNAWELMGLRFLQGLATAGLLPSINSLLKKVTPDDILGRMYGYNQAAQFLGSFAGALMGGSLAAAVGIHYVFFLTSGLLLINGIWVYRKVCPHFQGTEKINK